VQLDILFQFTKQTGANYFLGSYPGSNGYNQPQNVLNRWQKSGMITDVQMVSNNYSGNVNKAYINTTNSDKSFSDASYIRLKNISLSWQLPKAWVEKSSLKNCKLYAQGQNLLTITNYIGIDPETQNSKSIPPLSLFTLGLQVNL
jgi:hypothetical protein